MDSRQEIILFTKMSIPALPLVQPLIQWYNLQFRSRCTMVITIRVIFMCIVTQTMQFSTAFTTFTLVFSSRPTLICVFATLQATTVEPVASNTASKLRRCLTEWTSSQNVAGGQLWVLRGIRGAYENSYNP